MSEFKNCINYEMSDILCAAHFELYLCTMLCDSPVTGFINISSLYFLSFVFCFFKFTLPQYNLSQNYINVKAIKITMARRTNLGGLF